MLLKSRHWLNGRGKGETGETGHVKQLEWAWKLYREESGGFVASPSDGGLSGDRPVNEDENKLQRYPFQRQRLFGKEGQQRTAVATNY